MQPKFLWQPKFHCQNYIQVLPHPSSLLPNRAKSLVGTNSHVSFQRAKIFTCSLEIYRCSLSRFTVSCIVIVIIFFCCMLFQCPLFVYFMEFIWHWLEHTSEYADIELGNICCKVTTHGLKRKNCKFNLHKKDEKV